MSRAKSFANRGTQKPLDDNSRMGYRFIAGETNTSRQAKHVSGAHTQMLRPRRSPLTASGAGHRLTPQRRGGVTEGSRLPVYATPSRWARTALSAGIFLPRYLEIDSAKRLLQPRALPTIHLVHASVLFPPNMHCVHTWQNPHRNGGVKKP